MNVCESLIFVNCMRVSPFYQLSHSLSNTEGIFMCFYFKQFITRWCDDVKSCSEGSN